MPKFIRMRCLFLNPTHNEEVLAEMGVAVNASTEESWMVFDLEQVEHFNPSSDGGTTVGMRNGVSFILCEPFESFYKIMQKNIGKILEAK